MIVQVQFRVQVRVLSIRDKTRVQQTTLLHICMSSKYSCFLLSALDIFFMQGKEGDKSYHKTNFTISNLLPTLLSGLVCSTHSPSSHSPPPGPFRAHQGRIYRQDAPLHKVWTLWSRYGQHVWHQYLSTRMMS